MLIKLRKREKLLRWVVASLIFQKLLPLFAKSGTPDPVAWSLKKI
jgi:hypothetical protein